MREWLTQYEKKEKVENLYKEHKDKDLDASFLPYLKKINGITGVCTTQSCTGHNRPQKHGYISLRFDYAMHELFMNEVIHLIECPDILDINENFEIFGNYVRQRTVIWFKHYRWRQTIEKIIRILKKLSKKRSELKKWLRYVAPI